MNLALYNDGYSPIDSAFARTTAEWLADNLRLKRPVRFYLQGLYTQMDGQGVPILNTARPDPGHDGDAYSTGNIRVFISKKNTFPDTWEVNPACGDGYLNDVISFDNPYELFVFLAAHELRHLWQWEHPRQARQIRSLLRCTDETDSDIYAARKLSYYKTQ